ncbi:lamin tail domain-containing protein [uncultured Arcticibacterium sp.]|uniref:lamin tail domain-containing protein n=1 Tax=uncultured Arcticibacterium sp. TaxID=2173042 RepID=UPI0030F64449
MKKCFILFFLFCAFNLNAQILIFELYGGGGNSGATYNNDFVVLYNSGGAPASLNNHSLQYASSSGTSWAEQVLPNVSIAAGDYYFITIPTTGTSGFATPTPDLTSTSFSSGGIAASSGKLALMSNTTSLDGTSDPTLGPSAGLIDFVGYGTANAFEGGSAAPSGSNNSVVYRSGGTDSNVNGTDFASNSNLSTGSFAVNYTSFTGKLKIDAINLNWQTSTESNNQGFEVQKSRNAVNFETIARIDGAGNSEVLNNYDFVDTRPFEGSNYYRLKQTDFDGTADFSKIIQVLYDVNGSYVSIYPNPLAAGETLNIQKSESLELKAIKNILGQSFHTSSDLEEGLYFLQFTSSKGEKITKKLVVN